MIGNRVSCMNSFIEEEITSGRFAQALKKQYNMVTIAKNAMNIRKARFEVCIAVATAYEKMHNVLGIGFCSVRQLLKNSFINQSFNLSETWKQLKPDAIKLLLEKRRKPSQASTSSVATRYANLFFFVRQKLQTVDSSHVVSSIFPWVFIVAFSRSLHLSALNNESIYLSPLPVPLFEQR